MPCTGSSVVSTHVDVYKSILRSDSRNKTEMLTHFTLFRRSMTCGMTCGMVNLVANLSVGPRKGPAIGTKEDVGEKHIFHSVERGNNPFAMSFFPLLFLLSDSLFIF